MHVSSEYLSVRPGPSVSLAPLLRSPGGHAQPQWPSCEPPPAVRILLVPKIQTRDNMLAGYIVSAWKSLTYVQVFWDCLWQR